MGGKSQNKKKLDEKVGIMKAEAPKKVYKNVEEEMMDYLSNRKTDDFHEVLGAAKYSTGNPSETYSNHQDVETNPSKSEPPRPGERMKRGGAGDDDDDDGGTFKKPAPKKEAKPKRIFGAKKKQKEQTTEPTADDDD